MATEKYSEKKLRNTIFYSRAYHSYWLDRLGRVKNPKRDKITLAVLDLKDKTERKHQAAVKLFSGLLEKFLDKAVSREEPIYATYVPSSEANKESDGLRSVLDAVGKSFNIVNAENLLVRHKTVPKRSHGGDRSRKSIYESVNVVPEPFPDGAKVLLVDDVTTSKNSLRACKKLLYDKGAGLVITFAMTKTADD